MSSLACNHPWTMLSFIVVDVAKLLLLVMIVILCMCGINAGIMIYMYYRNRTITSYYMDTARNKKLMSVIGPLTKQYSPTFYLPFSLMKIMMTNDKKVILVFILVKS